MSCEEYINIVKLDSIVVAIDDKALFGKVTGIRKNSAGEPVIELALDKACEYKIVRE